LIAQGDKASIESRARPAQSENSTQSVESQSSRSSPKTRSPWDYTRYQHQPTFKSVRCGLSLSSAYFSWSEPDGRQHNPDQSNSRLPVRLASPMKFYLQWIQQGKVPPDQTSSVPVIAQSNCPVKVELNDGDVKDQFPASTIGIPAESTPGNWTKSNPGDREQPSVSTVKPVSEPTISVMRTDTTTSVSNRNERPDNNAASHPSDQAIYSDVQVLQSDRDSKASHNGVRVTSERYNDVRTSKVRVQGASPPVYPRVLQGRAKGRTSSMPSTQFAYFCIRRSNTASSRSTSSLDEKSQSGIVLGRTIVASRSNLQFDVVSSTFELSL